MAHNIASVARPAPFTNELAMHQYKIAPVTAIADRINTADRKFQFFTARDNWPELAVQAKLAYVRVAQSLVNVAITLASIERYHNFRGQFIAAHIQIARWLIQGAIEAIKLGIRCRLLVDGLSAAIPPLSYTRRVELWPSGYGDHSNEV